MPDPPGYERRIQEARETESRRLANIKAEDDALAKLPRDKRVLKPKSIEMDGRKYVELDMYGTRFRLPRDYVAQLPPDGKFVDGYFLWPEKWAASDVRVKEKYPSPSTLSSASDLAAQSEQFFRRSVKFWIDGERPRIDEKQLDIHRRLRSSQRSSIFSRGKLVAEIGSKYQVIFDRDFYIFSSKADIRSPAGDEIWLSRRSIAISGGREDDTFIGSFSYKGIEIAYLFRRLIASEWKEINEEMIRLLDSWTKE